MGMTIDLAKDILKHPTDYFPSEIDEANAYAIETMRKYQKIERIIRNYDTAWEFHHMKDTIDKIREVIE